MVFGSVHRHAAVFELHQAAKTRVVLFPLWKKQTCNRCSSVCWGLHNPFFISQKQSPWTSRDMIPAVLQDWHQPPPTTCACLNLCVCVCACVFFLLYGCMWGSEFEKGRGRKSICVCFYFESSHYIMQLGTIYGRSKDISRIWLDQKRVCVCVCVYDIDAVNNEVIFKHKGPVSWGPQMYMLTSHFRLVLHTN